MFEYAETRRKTYDGKGEGDPCFVPVCPNCARYVKADKTVTVNGLGRLVEKPNATCSQCGRVEMPFEGFISTWEADR